MPKGWVFDSSPLIVLGKIGALNVIASLPGHACLPSAVRDELNEGPDDDPVLAWLRAKQGRLKRVACSVPPAIAAWNLGKGEAQVIGYAKPRPGFVALLDDRVARDCAKSLRVRVMGTIGLLLWLRRQRKIPRLKPYLDAIASTDFRIDRKLVLDALRLAGER